jgi:hypothetical protein
MRNTILIAAALTALAAPALAATYPVSGRWGQSDSSNKGPIDCSKLRFIAFNGDQRTDSGGGVPAYRLKSISADGSSHFRVTDVFTTGQVNNGSARYTLRLIDAEHIEMDLQPSGAIRLQRCK